MELKRDLGLGAAISIVIGTVIGSGIFLVPHDMIARVHTLGMVFFIFVFGGLLSLAGALSYAELGAALPEAGGEYAYLREAYGPFWGFLYSWTQMWVAKSGSIATLATGFFLYLANFFPFLEKLFAKIPLPLGPSGTPLELKYGQVFAIVLILGLGGLNYFGVKIGGDVQTAVTIVKVVLFCAIIMMGLFLGKAHEPPPPSSIPLTSAGFFAALVAALWAYDGWNNISMVASEVREPQRNLPIALIGGTLAVMAIYLFANWAYFHVLTPQEVAANPRVAAEMMRHVVGEWGASAVSVAAMISIFAALNGSILTGSRVPYAAARDGLFFRAIAWVHPQFRTPGISIVTLTVWASVLIVLSGGYKELFTYVIFASWILYGMATAAVIVLRKKRPELPRPYRTLGYPFVPLLFVLVATLLVMSTLVDSPRESLKGLLIVLAGVPFYYYWKNRSARTRSGAEEYYSRQ
jgi:basic amino acid/polyamine antiporter, APA family